jgi:hypothetical protein
MPTSGRKMASVSSFIEASVYIRRRRIKTTAVMPIAAAR